VNVILVDLLISEISAKNAKINKFKLLQFLKITKTYDTKKHIVSERELTFYKQ